MRAFVTAVLAGTVVLSTAAALPAMEKELAAYEAAAFHACSRTAGVTPELQATYNALVASVERAQYGYGRTASPSNFWGPTSPQQLVERCYESPGEGAAAGDGE